MRRDARSPDSGGSSDSALAATAVAGSVAGALLGFGACVLLFEVAESGRNTSLPEALTGLVLPLLLLLGLRRATRSRPARARLLIPSILLGFAASFATIWLLSS